MNRKERIPNLGGAIAFVLHRSVVAITPLLRQLLAIGLEVRGCWPDLPAEALSADFVFFDVDMGFDEQFPWKPGDAPMPMIAIIGSEVPGRIEWALSQGADAHLVKPLGNSGVYSTMLIARSVFHARQSAKSETLKLKERVAERQNIVRAVVALSKSGLDEEQAFSQLRYAAMSWQITVEDAARRIVTLAGDFPAEQLSKHLKSSIGDGRKAKDGKRAIASGGGKP